jgi:hypothetical protein
VRVEPLVDRQSNSAATAKLAPIFQRGDVAVPGNHNEDSVSDGLRRAFGAWADVTEELDDYLGWNRQQRKHSRPEIQP